jgi:hypothetical protein
MVARDRIIIAATLMTDQKKRHPLGQNAETLGLHATAVGTIQTELLTPVHTDGSASKLGPEERNLALQRYGQMLQYLAVEYQMELSKNNLFMAANVALLVFEVTESPKIHSIETILGPYFICLTGFAIPFQWLRDLKQASCFCYQWEHLCIQFEPHAYDAYEVWRDNTLHDNWRGYHETRTDRKKKTKEKIAEEASKLGVRRRITEKLKWNPLVDLFRGHLPGARRGAAILFLGLWLIASGGVFFYVRYLAKAAYLETANTLAASQQKSAPPTPIVVQCLVAPPVPTSPKQPHHASMRKPAAHLPVQKIGNSN